MNPVIEPSNTKENTAFNNTLKKIKYFWFSNHYGLSPILFIGLITLFYAVYFAYERIYGDAGYYLFRLMNDDRFIIEHRRFIGVVVEVLPWILMKFGASVNNIVMFFSINEWLWFAGCCILLYRFYRIPALSIAMILVVLFGSRWNWFNPVSELIIASPLIFFLFAELYHKVPTSVSSIIRSLIYVAILSFSHPFYSMVIPWIFIMIILYDRSILRNKRFITIIVCSVLILIAHIFAIDGYDTESAAVVSPQSLHKTISLKLVFHLIQFFPALLMIILFSSISIIKSKKYLLLSVFLLSIFMFFMLVLYKYGQYYPGAYEPFERYLFPISIMVVAFWFIILKKSWNRILMVLALYHLFLLFHYGLKVKTRYEQCNAAIANAQEWKEGKIAIRAENYYPMKIGHDWTMAVESMLLSSFDNVGTTKQVWVLEAISPEVLSGITDSTFLYSPWWARPYKNLNQKYFQLPVGPMKIANTDTIQSNKSDTFFNNISIETSAPYILPVNTVTLIQAKITNQNSEPLYSGIRKEQRFISYHWKKENKIIEFDGERSPILMDVIHSSIQFIKIKTPKEKGEYLLIPDLVYEGKRWANLHKEIKYYIN